MYNSAGASVTSGALATTGLAAGHYVVAILALIALGGALWRLSYVARRRATARD